VHFYSMFRQVSDTSIPLHSSITVIFKYSSLKLKMQRKLFENITASFPQLSKVTILLKGTHAQDFHSLFLNFFLHLSVTNRYKTQYSQHFRKYSSNSPRYSKFSITCRFRRKREAWLSVVAENTALNLALSS
jgi:hypothetical protein